MPNPKKEFSKIYDQYIDKIYRFIFLKVSSQEIAEDLTSETFLKGWKSFQNPRDIENPSAFLYKIARNLVIDHYRQKAQKNTVKVEDFNIIDTRSNLEENAILTSDLNVAMKAIENLKDDYQVVIVWRYLDDLSISEVAEMLQKSEQATRVMIHRALKELRKQLA